MFSASEEILLSVALSELRKDISADAKNGDPIAVNSLKLMPGLVRKLNKIGLGVELE